MPAELLTGLQAQLRVLLFPWLAKPGHIAVLALRAGYCTLLAASFVLGECALWKSALGLQLLFATLGAAATRGMGRLPSAASVLLAGVLAFPWVAAVVGCGAYLAGVVRFAYGREAGALVQPDLLVAAAVWPLMVYAALSLRK
jgi:hypothetical protein